MDAAISIRVASFDDASILFEMLKDKAALEGLENEFSVNEKTLTAMMKRAKSVILIAEYSGQIAGMANYHFEDSTFTGDSLIMLDDLYTMPDFGGRGIAKAFLKYIAAEALSQGFKIKIAPLISNTRPLEWYKRLGARPIYDAQVLKIEDVDAFYNAL